MADTVVATHISSAISKPKRRKLTLMDAEALAQLVIGDKMTEVEACLNLGIHNGQWRNWKDRHKHSATFETLCARLRGSEIQHSMRTIKACGDGIGMKPPDWRAHAFRLQVIAPERFATNQGQNQQQPGAAALTAIGGEAGLLKLVAMYAGKAIADQAQVKTLPSVYTGPAIDVPCVSSVEASQTDYSI